MTIDRAASLSGAVAIAVLPQRGTYVWAGWYPYVKRACFRPYGSKVGHYLPRYVPTYPGT